MDYLTLISYETVEIEITREGHGMRPGVYKVGEGRLSHGKTLALLQDKKARITTLKKHEPIKSNEPGPTEVSTTDSEPVSETKNTKTRGNRSNRRKRSKKTKTSGKGLPTPDPVESKETSPGTDIGIEGGEGTGGGIGDIDTTGGGETQDPWTEEDN